MGGNSLVRRPFLDVGEHELIFVRVGPTSRTFDTTVPSLVRGEQETRRVDATTSFTAREDQESRRLETVSTHSIRQEQEPRGLDITESRSVSFRTPNNSTTALRLSAIRSPRSVGTATRGGPGQPETPVGGRWARDRGEGSVLERSSRLSEERIGSVHRDAVNGERSSPDEVTGSGRRDAKSYANRERPPSIEEMTGSAHRTGSSSFVNGSGVQSTSLAGQSGYMSASGNGTSRSREDQSPVNLRQDGDSGANKSNNGMISRSRDDTRSFNKSVIANSSRLTRASTAPDNQAAIHKPQEHSSSRVNGSPTETAPPADRRTVSFERGSAGGLEPESGGGDLDGYGSTRQDLATGFSRSRDGRSKLNGSQTRRNPFSHDSLFDTTQPRSANLSARERTEESPRRTFAGSPVPAIPATIARDSIVEETVENTVLDRHTQSANISLTREVPANASIKSSTQAESPGPVKSIDSITSPLLETAVGRHVLTWFEQHHLLEREEAEAATAEAEAEEALRRALAAEVEKPSVHVRGRDVRNGWWKGAYLAVMVLLAV